MHSCISTGLAAAASLALPLWAVAAPETEGAVLVVAAPWAAPEHALELVGRADGAILRGTGLPWVVLARSDDPRFAARLGAAGAWLVLDAYGLAGCAGRSTSRRT